MWIRRARQPSKRFQPWAINLSFWVASTALLRTSFCQVKHYYDLYCESLWLLFWIIIIIIVNNLSIIIIIVNHYYHYCESLLLLLWIIIITISTTKHNLYLRIESLVHRNSRGAHQHHSPRPAKVTMDFRTNYERKIRLFEAGSLGSCHVSRQSRKNSRRTTLFNFNTIFSNWFLG